MTIDESIMALERDIHNARLCGWQIDQYEVAIETMHKYQKIEQIIRNYDAACEFHTLRDTIDKIREVIEGGK